MVAKFPGAQPAAALNQVPCPIPGGGTATDLAIEQDELPAVFAGDVPLGGGQRSQRQHPQNNSGAQSRTTCPSGVSCAPTTSSPADAASAV